MPTRPRWPSRPSRWCCEARQHFSSVPGVDVLTVPDSNSHKPITALSGPNDDLLVPRMSWEKGGLDYEAELARHFSPK